MFEYSRYGPERAARSQSEYARRIKFLSASIFGEVIMIIMIMLGK